MANLNHVPTAEKKSLGNRIGFGDGLIGSHHPQRKGLWEEAHRGASVLRISDFQPLLSYQEDDTLWGIEMQGRDLG